MKKISKAILSILIAIIVVLVLTNPAPKAFREYLGVNSSAKVRRTSNWLIFSIYTTSNTSYKYYSDEKYFGIFSNFFRLQSDD